MMDVFFLLRSTHPLPFHPSIFLVLFGGPAPRQMCTEVEGMHTSSKALDTAELQLSFVAQLEGAV